MVRIGEISVKKTENNERNRKETYYCKECGYRSDRRFNVERHEKRIHSKSITKKCCNTVFFKKSDYYHHIEDNHPNMRSSCFVSKKKYKIYGRRMKLSTGFSYKTNFENTVNSSNISDECTTMRRSVRIHQQVVKRGRLLSLMETSTESEFDECDDDDMDVDYYDYNEFEELTDDLHNHQQMNSLNAVSEEYENNRHEESKNIDNRTKTYQKSNLDTIKDENSFQSLLVDTEIKVQENINTVSRLPLKKRILCEINNNIERSSIPKNNEIKINKTSFGDKENQNPIDIFLNEYQGATIVKQILTVDESVQIWNNITQRQRNYLRSIDFNSF